MTTAPTILQILPQLSSGGVERGTVEIAQAIVAQGWKSLVISSGGPLSASLAYAGAEHISLPVHSKNPWRIYRNISALTRLIKKHRVSIVHARSRAPAWSAYYAAKRAGVPFVTTFHGVYQREGRGKHTYNSIMARGDKVIAVSNYVRDHILTYYPECPPENITVIHRGADIGIFHPNAVKPGILVDLANKWRLSDHHAPVIMLPGRLSRWKGHRVFIEALKRIEQRDFNALLVGDDGGHPDYAREMEQLIVTLGLEGRVRFVGKTTHMTEAYALSDIVVVPSTEPEAFGRVPVEAQAMGKLVITSNHGGACETVIHGETGFLVEPSDAEALAAYMSAALDMPVDCRNELGSRAMAHVDAHFSVAAMQAKTLELYASLL